jgi:hypothetical protein
LSKELSKDPNLGKFTYSAVYVAIIVLMLASDVGVKPFIVMIAILEVIREWVRKNQ